VVLVEGLVEMELLILLQEQEILHLLVLLKVVLVDYHLLQVTLAVAVEVVF